MSVHDSAIACRPRPVLGPGTAWGAAGVLAFSLTFPASRAALPAFGPVTVGLGRAVLASLLAVGCLRLGQVPRPTSHQWRRLVLVTAGVVIGFPICSAMALRDATSSHGAVLTGLLPAATAAIAVARGGERPARAFWFSCLLGVLAVLAFAWVQGAGGAQPADVWLLAAVLLGAMGYAEGGALARELGGWQVISWALVLSVPLLVPATLVGLVVRPPDSPTASAWVGLAYVSAISMFGGFVLWYRGLAEGGVARISQLQLAQPVLTLAWSAVLLGERVDLVTVLAGLAVVSAVAGTQRSRQAGAAAADVQKVSSSCAPAAGLASIHQ